MKRLSFCYRSVITMDAPVTDYRFSLRCVPKTDARQETLSIDHSAIPNDFIESCEDQWGNAMLYGVCREKHSRFEVKVTGTILTGIMDHIPEPRQEIRYPFLYPTPLTRPDDAILQFAEENRLSGASAFDQAFRIMRALHARLTYIPGETTTATTAAEAFASGRGVCQDYAHIMLAVLRALEIPARYVVGIMVGEGQSHAWVEALCDDSWYGFDPTNDQPVTDSHISFAHGRDYADCVIDKGIFRGFCRQNIETTVSVKEI